MSEVLRALESFRIIRLSMAFSAQANLKTPQMDPSSHIRPIGLISPLSSYGQVFPSHLVEDHYVWGMCPSPFLCFSLFLMSLDNNVVWYSLSLMCVWVSLFLFDDRPKSYIKRSVVGLVLWRRCNEVWTLEPGGLWVKWQFFAPMAVSPAGHGGPGNPPLSMEENSLVL